MKEWMPTSNYWDPVRDMNEALVIVGIRGFKKLDNTGYYLVQYKPVILDAFQLILNTPLSLKWEI